MHRYTYNLFAFIAFFFAFNFRLFAQRFEVQEWPKGRIILISGDTLYGPVTYHRNEDAIRITLPDGSINAFTPVNVQSFTVSDGSDESTQKFQPYLWNRGNDYSDYKVPAFFEILTEGRYTLVRRETLSRQISSPMYAGYGRYYDPYGYNNSRYQTVITDLLYLYTPDGKLLDLRNPKKDLEEIFKAKSRDLKDFVKRNNLSYTDTRDIILIIKHFNNFP